MQIERRVCALEQRTKPGHRFDAIVVHFVKPGPNGPIAVEAVGYSSMGRDEPGRRWMREDGETIEQTLERARRESCIGLPFGCIPSLRAICVDEAAI
ncbi:MAG: hypothetical protein JNM97_22320 [Rhodoferax sp.]|nr:hypothetical protein [Rhodoferax sp.]